ncbi:MAG: pilus assembly protein [Gammaproteobacteria bacterium]|nr:pilus assembly protein [Gammaproteobacteria bacterium]
MKFKTAILNFLKEEEGLTTVEYAIAGSLVGVGVIVAFDDLGKAVCGVIDQIEGTISTGTVQAYAACP